MRTAQVAEEVGVSRRTLSRWVSLGLCNPTVRAAGKQDHHVWFRQDLRILRLVRILTAEQLEHETIRKAVAVAQGTPRWDGLVLTITAGSVAVWPLEQIPEAVFWAEGIVTILRLALTEPGQGVDSLPIAGVGA